MNINDTNQKFYRPVFMVLFIFSLTICHGQDQEAKNVEEIAYVDYYDHQNDYAEKIFLYKNSDSIKKAITIWNEIKYGDQDFTDGVIIDPTRISSSLEKKINSNLSLAYKEIAEIYTQQDSLRLALNYYGKKINLDNPNQINKYFNLITSDSLMNKLEARSLPVQLDFVKKTNEIFKSISIDLLDKLNIDESNKAYGIVEELVFKGELAKMILKSENSPTKIYYRRWFTRKTDGSDWISVLTDTTLVVKRARYEIKYFDGNKEIVEGVNCPCVPPINK